MEVVLLVGLAVGVDYALFYMRREREERAAGRSEGAALEAAAATSGRAVLVSGITVLIAMAGMFLSGDKTFMSFSVGTMIVVAVAMIGSLTVLPGDALGGSATRSRRGASRSPAAAAARAARAASGARSSTASSGARSSRRSPRGALLLALAAAGARAAHRADGHRGHHDPGGRADRARSSTRSPARPSPAVVAIKADDVNAPQVQDAIAELERQALATGEMNAPIDVEVNRDGTVATVEIPLAGNGTDDDSNARARHAPRRGASRRRSARSTASSTPSPAATANSQDFNAAQTKSMPLVFGFVLLFAFGLLLVSFRSIVIALKAIVLNLLSVGAAYGVLVAVFQWGWGESLLDFQSNGGIANWLPMFMFVILFGLSMDYHVFILSRIREALRPRPLDRRRGRLRHQVDGRRGHQRRGRDGRRLPRSSRCCRSSTSRRWASASRPPS